MLTHSVENAVELANKIGALIESISQLPDKVEEEVIDWQRSWNRKRPNVLRIWGGKTSSVQIWPRGRVRRFGRKSQKVRFYRPKTGGRTRPILRPILREGLTIRMRELLERNIEWT